MTTRVIESSGLQRPVIRLVIVLAGLLILRSILAGVGMLQQQISPFSPITAMVLIDATLSLIAIGVTWSFRQTMSKQLALVYNHSPEIAIIFAGVIGLLIVGFAYSAYSYFAQIFLGWQLIWIYNVLFLLLAFASAFRMVETILVRITRSAGSARTRSRT